MRSRQAVQSIIFDWDIYICLDAVRHRANLRIADKKQYFQKRYLWIQLVAYSCLNSSLSASYI